MFFFVLIEIDNSPCLSLFRLKTLLSPPTAALLSQPTAAHHKSATQQQRQQQQFLPGCLAGRGLSALFFRPDNVNQLAAVVVIWAKSRATPPPVLSNRDDEQELAVKLLLLPGTSSRLDVTATLDAVLKQHSDPSSSSLALVSNAIENPANLTRGVLNNSTTVSVGTRVVATGFYSSVPADLGVTALIGLGVFAFFECRYWRHNFSKKKQTLFTRKSCRVIVCVR